MEKARVEELKAFIESLCDENGKFKESDLLHQATLNSLLESTFYLNGTVSINYDPEECSTSYRTIEELFFINQVCKKYSELLGEKLHLQYLEIGTCNGASVISACINNVKVLGWAIDLYEDIYSEYCSKEKAEENFSNSKFGVADRIQLIEKDSSKIQLSDLIEKGFNPDQGIHVFFYDGCDGGENDDAPDEVTRKIQIIRDTFIKIIPFMNDICVCIFNQKIIRDRTPELSGIFKNILRNQYFFNPLDWKLSNGLSYSQFHCYLLEKKVR